jgi:hypothetical protein
MQQALHLQDHQILLSDLQLSRNIIPKAAFPTSNKGDLYVDPYPFPRVERSAPLFLYFEIYQLQVTPDGRTNYKIAYEAEQISKKQNLWSKVTSWLGRKGGQVELESDYSGDSKNTREWISLDLQALSPGEVKLTVVVTDLLTGKVSKRSVNFELI